MGLPRFVLGGSFAVCLLFASASLAQITFERTYGATFDDQGFSVQQTQDLGYIIAGNTLSFGVPSQDFYLVKTDSLGNTLWARTYGIVSDEVGNSVLQTADGGYIIAGWTGPASGPFDVYLVKTDSLGDSLWAKIYSSAGGGAYSIQQTSDGGFILSGFIGQLQAFTDAYLIKTDDAGNPVWTQRYTHNYAGAFSVRQTTDGGFILAGWTGIIYGLLDVYLIKTDTLGDTLWTRTYGDSINDEYGTSVQQTADGGYIIAGRTGPLFGPYDVYLLKTDSSGDSLWTKTYGEGLSDEQGWSVQQTQDGGYIIAGEQSFGDPSVYLIKTDPLGNALWTRNFRGNDFAVGHSVQQTADLGFIIAGFTESYGTGESDVYLIKTGPEGLIVGVEEDNEKAKMKNAEFRLIQSLPNPFLHSTVIRYQLASTSHVILKVYDITGRLVETLVDESQGSGLHRMKWDGLDNSGEKVPSSIYFYRLEAGRFTDTKKLTLLR